MNNEMNNEIVAIIILFMLSGFGLTAGSLYASFHARTGDAAAGYGFLTFFLFLGTIITVGVTLAHLGVFR